MPLNFIFRQPKNELEKGGRTPVAATSDDMELAKPVSYTHLAAVDGMKCAEALIAQYS